jgi:hypothetical protein
MKYFNVCEYTEENSPKDIEFLANNEVTDFPDNVIDLKNEFELFMKLINSLFKENHDLHHYYYQRLYGLADLAFNGKNNQIMLATKSLEKLKVELVHEVGPSIRSDLLFKFIKICTFPFAIMFLFVVGLNYFPINDHSVYISKLLLVSMSAQVGCWLSLATRTKSVNFNDIMPIISDKRGLKARALFVSVFSVTMALLMKSGLISLTLGAFSSSSIENDIFAAVAAGVLMGFSEKIFVDKFEAKIKSIKI